MICLTRKIGERIQIGDIWVEVLEIGSRRVKLSIVAPRDVNIVREELLQRDEAMKCSQACCARPATEATND